MEYTEIRIVLPRISSADDSSTFLSARTVNTPDMDEMSKPKRPPPIHANELTTNCEGRVQYIRIPQPYIDNNAPNWPREPYYTVYQTRI